MRLFDSSWGKTRRRPPPRRHKPEAWWALSLPLLLFLLLPLLALLFYSSPAELAANLALPQVRQAIGLSLRTSSWATLAAVAMGTPVAYLLARRQFYGRLLLDNLIDLPIVLPPAVAGLSLLLVFGRRGWVGAPLDQLGIRITFTELAVIMAQTFIAVSLFIRAASIGFAAVEPELEDAAAIDGANRWQSFWRITLPLSRRAVLTGVALAWARALGEFGATIIFAGNFPGRTQTMPLAIYLGFELDLDVAVTLSVILIGLSFAALMAIKLIFRPRDEDLV
ncbi:Molybdate ABC transporter, inner membrane subunit [Candidatus Promineifilum breve]|uniref:Molybdenum transport system permease n=1 Tax=Candidatus Promineifilum breve TaxID=1806508 RepID=A0A160T0U8_9CHLR|nr:ABC transporter permease [Candidatus Promineifilum breve]CUS03052.2 Molybdate ABC transporter, inner membrane subunit [Candidatus Promineifilum breve]